jgi:tetratricopeptide (TPR) repeat protein
LRRLAFIFLLVFSSRLQSGEGTISLFSAAKVAQPWLAVSVDPRSAALGDAMVASSDDVHALNINPAGLSRMLDPQLSFQHNEWSSALGLRQEYLAYGRRVGDGGLGLAFNYFSFGNFENRDANGAMLESSSDAAYALSAGYGTSFFSDKVQMGLKLEASQESLGSVVSSLYTLGLGLQYQLFRGLWLGGAVSGIGLNSSDAGEAPGYVHGGLAWQPFHKSLVLAAEYLKPNQGEGTGRFGLEWNLFEQYSLRAGWRLGSGDVAEVDRGFSAGAGIHFGPFQLDYAYVPYQDFSPAHRVGISMNLSEGLFAGNSIVIESAGVTQNAQAEFTDGVAAYKARDWYVAKVSLNRALKIYPSFEKAGEIKVMLEDIDKKIASDKSHGMTPEQKAKIKQKLQEAKKLMDAGQTVQARKEVEAVLEFDGNLKDAVGLLNQINSNISARLGGLKQEAFTALSQGDLRTGLLKYRKVLEIDNSDAEAISRLRKLSPRIRSEAKKMHREGIEFYVNGDVNKAIAVWEQALELDPSDQENVKRDLFKAKKLKELSGDR